MSTQKPADRAAAARWIGQRVGSHRLVRLLGEGGMGMVFEGTHEGVAGRAAIKILRGDVASRPEVVTRFFNEARAANAIDHPGIVRIHDSGFTESGAAYLTMEFLEGESLRSRVDRVEQLATGDALRIARQLASALVAAHRKNVIHRDLKPDNIMLVPDPDLPGGERVKILDFGIAKIAESLSATPMHTRSDMLMGTPTYMAPEQCRGAKSVTERSDVYSLAVILYQLLSGRPPFVGDSVGELIAMHLMDPPPSLRVALPQLEPGVIDLIDRMLLKKPEQRPAMEGVFQELQRLELSLHSAAALASRELSPVPTVLYANVTRPEPQTAVLQQVSQLAVIARTRSAEAPVVRPTAPLVPVATAVQPVIRQPGPGMRTVSLSASEWVQPGVPKARTLRTVALTVGVLGAVTVGTLALSRLSEDAPSSVSQRVAKRDPARAATTSVTGGRTPSTPEGATAATSTSSLSSGPSPVAAEPEKIIDPRLVAASAAYKAELYDKAIKSAEPLVRAFPLEARWIIGMSACKQQNTLLSDRILREIGGLDRGDTGSSLAEIKLACQQQRDLKKLNLRNPFEPVSTAQQYYDLKQYRQARAAAELTINLDPIKSWDLIGRASCALKDPLKAGEALTHLEQNPTVPVAGLEALKQACDSLGYTFSGGRFRHK